MTFNASKLTQKELTDILITCDGKGKEIKEAALRELMDRQYVMGYDQCDRDDRHERGEMGD